MQVFRAGRGWLALSSLIGTLLLAPLVADTYALSVLTMVLWFAYVGQAWNIMMGYAGQLSLGHALYTGIGAYTSAALFRYYGLPPSLGLWVGVLLAMMAGAVVAVLGFRFRVRGVYFALITIALAECARIAVEHVAWLGGAGGFFLPVGPSSGRGVLALGGSSTATYYVMLALMLLGLLMTALLVNSRYGFFWRAIREDADAAAASGVDVLRYKTTAVVISAGMAALGGSFYAFYFNNLFPDATFSMGRSLEFILAPIVGGVGTLFGPLVGALILTPLGEAVAIVLAATGLAVPGARQLIQGLALILIMVFLPGGVWPWIARNLRLSPYLRG